ncbi:MAG: hypothetical protein KZQ84_01235 [Candidatus Thiodiazotropha sp. (ex Lucinoma borealis)]|nr:hypothetical protein [Candidatus Thiodiazotropha sp. (ex Lucinoma borealis)]
MSDQRKQPETPLDDHPIQALYQTTRQELPSAELDRQILALASREASRRRRRWLFPLSSAAVILLGVTLTLQLVEPPELAPESEELLLEAPDSNQRSRTSEVPHKSISMPVPTVAKPSMEFPQDSSAKTRQAPAGFAHDAESQNRQIQQTDRQEVRRKELLQLGRQKKDAREIDSDPQLWLEIIGQQIESGKVEAGQLALAEFRKRYPDYPLPEHLQQYIE